MVCDAETSYFTFSATLRIQGAELDFDRIRREIGADPSYTHRAGEPIEFLGGHFEEDAWHLESDLDESEDLRQHLRHLWARIGHAAVFLRALKPHAKVDVFCGYRSNCDHAGLEVGHDALRIFTELEIPFGLSVIVI